MADKQQNGSVLSIAVPMLDKEEGIGIFPVWVEPVDEAAAAPQAMLNAIFKKIVWGH